MYVCIISGVLFTISLCLLGRNLSSSYMYFAVNSRYLYTRGGHPRSCTWGKLKEVWLYKARVNVYVYCLLFYKFMNLIMLNLATQIIYQH